jgi:hypothetical protein
MSASQRLLIERGLVRCRIAVVPLTPEILANLLLFIQQLSQGRPVLFWTSLLVWDDLFNRGCAQALPRHLLDDLHRPELLCLFLSRHRFLYPDVHVAIALFAAKL